MSHDDWPYQSQWGQSLCHMRHQWLAYRHNSKCWSIMGTDPSCCFWLHAIEEHCKELPGAWEGTVGYHSGAQKVAVWPTRHSHQCLHRPSYPGKFWHPTWPYAPPTMMAGIHVTLWRENRIHSRQGQYSHQCLIMGAWRCISWGGWQATLSIQIGSIQHKSNAQDNNGPNGFAFNPRRVQT